uniref:Endonuclease/exonuclease/phosphatase domain-containing protein n=1 Tax=Glossina pallidipes TaxID=7398 RepID=A0A1A9Z8M6_GLOPL
MRHHGPRATALSAMSQQATLQSTSKSTSKSNSKYHSKTKPDGFAFDLQPSNEGDELLVIPSRKTGFVPRELHVVVIAETWLKSEVNSSEVSYPEYQVFTRGRCDKIDSGILIAVRFTILTKLLSISNLDSAQNLNRIFVTCPYPASDTHTQPHSHSGSVLLLGPNDILIMLGDFNMISIGWDPYQEVGFYVPCYTSIRCDSIFEDICKFRLMQLNKSEGDLHPPICISLDVEWCKRNELDIREQEYNFFNTNYGTLHMQLSVVNWESCNSNLDSLLTFFYDTLKSTSPYCLPLKPIGSTSMCPEWSAKDLKGIRKYCASYMVAKQRFLAVQNKCYSKYLLKKGSWITMAYASGRY